MSDRRRSLGALLALDLVFTTAVSGIAVMGALYLVLGVGASGVTERGAGRTLPEWIDADAAWAPAAQRVIEVVTLDPGVGHVVLPSVPTMTRARRPTDLEFTGEDMMELLRDNVADPPRRLASSYSRWWDWPYWIFYDGDRVADIHAGRFDVNRHSGEYDGEPVPFGIFFYSAFATSVWLWLHAAAVLVSRILLRMNSGVGFLLRVTDVERQPFRSMGFVSVVLVSGLFLLGLPLVLL